MEDKIREAIQENEENKSILENVVSYVEEKYEREKDEFPTLADKFEWHEVGVMPQKLMKLVYRGVLTIAFKSRSSTYYQLVDFDLTKRVLSEVEIVEEAEKKPIEEKETPSDLFSPIIGYEDAKDLFMRSIEASKPVHILLVGDPATAKTLFMEEVSRLSGSYFVETGGRTSKVGLADVIYEYKPRYLIIDEIADADKDIFSVLKPLMESGKLDETIRGRREKLELDTRVYATTNYLQKVPYEIKSRFAPPLYFKQYEHSEFLEICKRFLMMREGTNQDIAGYIASRTWDNLGGDVRHARSIYRLLREETKEDVDKCVEMLKKYSLKK